jgi:hypothetical protein
MSSVGCVFPFEDNTLIEVDVYKDLTPGRATPLTLFFLKIVFNYSK